MNTMDEDRAIAEDFERGLVGGTPQCGAQWLGARCY